MNWRAPLAAGHFSGWKCAVYFAVVFYFYPLYLYFNFAGYCDIAIAANRFFGMRLPENFNRPWLARNVLDFWTRWHITLGTWIRDYLFMPMYKPVVERWPKRAAGVAWIFYFLAFLAVGRLARYDRELPPLRCPAGTGGVGGEDLGESRHRRPRPRRAEGLFEVGPHPRRSHRAEHPLSMLCNAVLRPARLSRHMGAAARAGEDRHRIRELSRRESIPLHDSTIKGNGLKSVLRAPP